MTELEQLKATVENLTKAVEMHARSMREVTRVLIAFDERLKLLEKQERRARRRGLILPDATVSEVGHG